MADNKFLVFNTNKSNMQSDTDYAAETQRANGVVNGIAKADMHNKLFRQTSVMAAAIGELVKAAGYDATDSDVSALVNNLSNTLAQKPYVDAQLAETTNLIVDQWDIGTVSHFTQWKDVVFGIEYLAIFYKNYLNNGKTAIVPFSGDSSTSGHGLSDPDDWRLDNAFKKFCTYHGITGITTLNKGYSGMCTEHWNRTYVTQDAADNPILYIARWGINDPSYDKDLNHLADDGQNYNIRRNADDFYKSLNEGLAKFRAIKSADECTIILMTPNSVSDDLSFRNEKWVESINSKIRYLARKYNCVFVDTYRLFQDSRNPGNMDNINNGHIHPGDYFNMQIVDFLYNVIFPKNIEKTYTSFYLENLVTPLNSWTNNSGTYKNLGFVKENNKKIRLQGTITGGIRTVGTVIGVFPASPVIQMIVGCGENGAAYFYIDMAGDLKIINVPATGWISLDGCNYLL